MFGVCVCVLFIYTISLSIICVSQEKLQSTDTWLLQVIFEKKRYCERKQIFDISDTNAIQIFAVST